MFKFGYSTLMFSGLYIRTRIDAMNLQLRAFGNVMSCNNRRENFKFEKYLMHLSNSFETNDDRFQI